MAFISRFNPKPGILDLWHEWRKPNPYRWPILLASMVPFGVLGLWLGEQEFYAAPEKPQIDYITSFAPDRSDEEIIASNIANQEVKELREAQEEELAERKRDLYKALGRATGMDVDAIDERARAERAAQEAELQAQIEERRVQREQAQNQERQAEPSNNEDGTQSASSSPAESRENP